MHRDGKIPKSFHFFTLTPKIGLYGTARADLRGKESENRLSLLSLLGISTQLFQGLGFGLGVVHLYRHINT
jgi:hypothetical protein